MSTTKSKLLTFCIVLTPVILGKERSLNSNKRSDNLDECKRCKVLTDSFHTWLDKTSRGKHEGGDVAWEETKLKLYSRSEMRLVEIQEGLCSELKTHQDHCYMIAEEAEHVIEKWWFIENHDDTDLYTWLCIENLKYCCPPSHFGALCTPCPSDTGNKICGGNGKCDGDGTRRGNGTCICKKGYSGRNCRDCATHYYKTMNACKPCHKACDECHDDGPGACVQCKSGWIMKSHVCIDINECVERPSICKVSEFCMNTEGSFACKVCDSTCRTCIGPSPKDCTSCKPDNIMWIGKCMSSDHKRALLTNIFFRTLIYISLFIVLFVMLSKSLSAASLVALLIAVVMFFNENTSDVKLIDLYNHYYYK